MTLTTITSNPFTNTGTTSGLLNAGLLDTLTNSGTISGSSIGVVNTGSLGTLTNSGLINGTFFGVMVEAGTINLLTNTGIISSDHGPSVENSGGYIGSLVNQTSGTLNGGHTGVYNYSGCTIAALTNNGLISVQFQGIGNLGTIGSFVNSGTIINQSSFKGDSLGGVHNRGLISTLANSGSISAVNNFNQLAGGAQAETIVTLTNTGNIGSVLNEGLISSFTNSATIGGGASGIRNTGTVGSLSNSGVISGSSFVINSTGTIQGTLTNTGSIEGNFVLAGQNLTIAGGTGGTAGTLSGGALTINGGSGSLELTAGSEYLADSNAYSGGTTIDAGATLGVADQADLGSGAITFGGDGASLDLTGLIFSGAGAGSPDGLDVLTVIEGAGTTLQLAGDYTGETFLFSADGGTGTLITEEPACYGRGTMILADRGEVAVEDLVIGDLLVTASGAVRPVKWIGRRRYAGRFVAGNRAVLPVCIKAGALAAGIPSRDLMVSPQHAIYFNGMLFPAATLLNGSTIAQLARVAEVEYFHVELDSHDVILADGAWAETFVDDGSRGIFHNVAEYRKMYPDEVRGEICYCAPRIEDGAELEAVRSQLADRAAGLVAA